MRGLLIMALCCPTLGFAQGGNEISVTLGLGAESKPAYFGAADTETGPSGHFALDSLSYAGVTFGAETKQGLGFGGSLRFVPMRDSSDHVALAGMADVDAAFELGGGLRYTAGPFDLFGNLRYGVIGHQAFVAEAGGDFTYRPADAWTLRLGPRMLWGDTEYAQTYFGVTAAESLASGISAYDADAGLISTGIKAEAVYQVTPDWGVVGTVRFDTLQGDAADSPIVQDKDQTIVGVMVTRKVTFGF
jgi:MipA family protein